MKAIKRIVLFLTIGFIISCSSNRPRYSKFHKIHNQVKDNSKY
jgi:hypothetical protein